MGLSMQLVGMRETLNDYKRLNNVIDRGNKSNAVWVVSAGDDEVDYAAYVELGTYKMEAQPYFIPAVRKVASDPQTHVDMAKVETVNDYIREVAYAIRDEAQDNVPVDTGALQDSIAARRVR